MHIAMFGDQHIESLGGAQVSMRLQRRFLERSGHTVTVVGPRMHGRRAAAPDPSNLDMPSVPVTPDREYSMTWPGRRADRWLDRAFAARPPVDVVHVQADFWGAFLAYRYADRHGMPVVHTMHNRVDVGIEAVSPAPALMLRALNGWERRMLPPAAMAGTAAATTGTDGWSYLARMAARARAVTAPSSHFARRLEEHGVFPAVDVIWNGIDDDVLDAAMASGRGPREPGPPRFVWVGRMSPEKRMLPFLEAVAASGVRADVEVIGGGAQLAAARRAIERRRGAASVVFSGRLPYEETLRRLRGADAVVQTSVGFETQGMTVFEAAALGTPAVVCDADIAAELGGGVWPAGESVAELTQALRTAAADIEARTTPEVDPAIAGEFRQSSRTAAMVEVYERVTARS